MSFLWLLSCVRFFVYFGYVPIIRYMICSYFLSLRVGCLFILLIAFFAMQVLFPKKFQMKLHFHNESVQNTFQFVLSFILRPIGYWKVISYITDIFLIFLSLDSGLILLLSGNVLFGFPGEQKKVSCTLIDCCLWPPIIKDRLIGENKQV